MGADSNFTGLYVSAETNWGETPSSPNMDQVRFTGETLARQKQSVLSETIRSDRMRDTIADVGYQAGGDINFELAYASYDKFLEALMGNSYTVVTTGTLTTLSATGTGFDRSAGSFITDGFIVGQHVKVTGFTQNSGENNGIYLITAVGATSLTTQIAPANTETAGDSVEIKGDYLRNGVTKKSLLIEKRFTDLTNVNEYFTGCRVGSMDLSITALERITGSFSILGKDAITSASVLDATPNAASASVVMTASANVGNIVENGVALTTAIRSISMQATNNLRIQNQVGSKAAAGIGYGFFEVTGTMEAYFEDLGLYNKIRNHTATSLSFDMTDVDGNSYSLYFPKIFFMDGSPNAPQGNTDVVVPIQFGAVQDPTTSMLMQITRMAA